MRTAGTHEGGLTIARATIPTVPGLDFLGSSLHAVGRTRVVRRSSWYSGRGRDQRSGTVVHVTVRVSGAPSTCPSRASLALDNRRRNGRQIGRKVDRRPVVQLDIVAATSTALTVVLVCVSRSVHGMHRGGGQCHGLGVARSSAVLLRVGVGRLGLFCHARVGMARLLHVTAGIDRGRILEERGLALAHLGLFVFVIVVCSCKKMCDKRNEMPSTKSTHINKHHLILITESAAGRKTTEQVDGYRKAINFGDFFLPDDTA